MLLANVFLLNFRGFPDLQKLYLSSGQAWRVRERVGGRVLLSPRRVAPLQRGPARVASWIGPPLVMSWLPPPSSQRSAHARALVWPRPTHEHREVGGMCARSQQMRCAGPRCGWDRVYFAMYLKGSTALRAETAPTLVVAMAARPERA